MRVITKQSFSALFKVGEIVESGVGSRRADAAHLEILAIDDEFIRYRSLRSKSKNRLRYSYLEMLVNSFDELDSRAIQKSVNKVLKKSGFPANYSTENYSYTFAKAYVTRNQGAFFTSQGEVTMPGPQGNTEFTEGARIQVLVERIERDRNARRACIEHFGTDCQACGMNFAAVYGPIGEGFIHVHHHRTQIADREGEHNIDPVEDLIPVCPNCHAMIHSQREMLSIEQVRKYLTGGAQVAHP